MLEEVIFFDQVEVAEPIEKEGDNAKLFKCSLCTSSFAKRKGLYYHNLRVHPKSKPQTCELCEKVFKSKKHVDDHRTTVHKPSYSCIHCSKQIKSLKRLKYHEKFCGTWKRSKGHIPCGLCDKTLSTEYNLKGHIRRVHTVVNSFGTFVITDPVENKKIREKIICSLCQTTIKKTNYLKKQIKLVHETKKDIRKIIQIVVERVTNEQGQYQFNCSQCIKCFEKESFAKDHIRRVHVVKTFNCELCKKKFKLKQTHKGHLNRHINPNTI